MEQVSSRRSGEVPGTSQVIGAEEAAWGPESPQRFQSRPRAGKKRKSDEISTGPMRKAGSQGRQADTPKRDERAHSVDFVDIDDIVATDSQSKRERHDSFRGGLTRLTVEHIAMDDFEDDSLSENSNGVKSLLPLSDGEASTCFKITRPPAVSKIWSLPSAPPATARPLSTIQLTLTTAKPSSSRSTQTSEKRQKIRQDRTVQDSGDEDDVFSEETPSERSLPASAKHSPINVASATPSALKDIPASELSENKARIGTDPMSRVGSPLKPISQNAGIKQDNAPLPPSALSAEDKRLAVLYLKTTLTTASYYLRVKNLISHNAISSVAYTDAGDLAPPALKAERIKLLTMERSYLALESLRERYKAAIAKKVAYTSKVLELLGTGADYSVHEKESSLLTREILRIERETAQHLHASGAIKDGFGTGSNAEQTHNYACTDFEAEWCSRFRLSGTKRHG